MRWLLLLALLPRIAHASSPSSEYLRELIEKSRRQNLSAEKHWLRLVHYKRAWTTAWNSEADGRAFFLSPQGRTNPKAELEATLAGFFQEEITDTPAQHPQCQFPARFSWLQSRLDFDLTRLRQQKCTRFEEFRTRLSARSVTLVFSSYYLNNPASAFGHIFLRTNKTDLAYQGKRFELLDYGIDYSATVDTSNALIYGFKGMTGLFPGRFNYYPYFYKVREYNDFESRDLWEYDLDFTHAQVDLLVAHLWELGSTYFDYYYVTANCAYHILTALEAARPDLELSDRVGWFVIPANSVKAVFSNKALVRGVHYRPSIHTQFQSRLDNLSADQRSALAALIDDREAPLPARLSTRESVDVLDAALDYADLRYAKDLVAGTDREPVEFKQHLLERRSEIRVPSENLVIEPPWNYQPQLGHGTKRARLGGGYSTAVGPYGEIEFRMGLHDLADPFRGYPELAQIDFFPTELRYNTDFRSLWLEDFSIVRVLSLSSINRFEMKPSWNFRLGATTVRDGGCDSCLAGLLEMGGGVARSWFGSKLTLFGFAQGQLLGSPPLHGKLGLPLRLGVGPLAGVRLRIGDAFSTVLTGSYQYLLETAPRWTYWASVTSRLHVGMSLSVGMDIKKLPQGWEGSIAPLIYF